jgi:hypothetical protein
MEQMPPMDMQPEMGDDMDMGGNIMPQGDMQQPPMDGGMEDNQFDADFDAGVEADEEQDPKKYIQQLTGKLSQSLQKYTEKNGQTDVELNKYVAGMITKQAMKGLSEQDAEDIIDKVKADEDFSMEDGGDEDMPQQQPPMDGEEMPQQGQEPQGQNMMPPQTNEGYRRFSRNRQIREIVNGVLDGKKEEETPRREPRNNGGYRTRAYTSPNFK